MKRNKSYLFIPILTLTLLFTTSAVCNQCTGPQSLQQITNQLLSDSKETMQVKAQETTHNININDMSWNSELEIIEVTLDKFPSWDGWKMYVDGKEMPMDGGAGNAIVRPNKALDNNPTGLYIGTDPWITGLRNIDFPVCGTLQFDIPDQGLTNVYQFNLSSTGCKTASTKDCQATLAEQESSTQTTTTTTTESNKKDAQTTTTTTGSTTKQGVAADIRATDIYPDKQPNGVIFARITNDGPDTLNGSKVTVTVSGSQNDISNASTANFITKPKEYLLTLKPGETQVINLGIDIDTSKYSYNFTMTASPVDFTDPNNGNNSYTEKVAATQNQQGASTQGAADIVITDLFPKDTDWPTGELLIKVTNNGPAAIENKKITITISGSQEDPLGNKANFILVMEKFWVDGKEGSTISLKPGETKIIYPRDDKSGVLFFIYNYKYKYNFNLTINAVDFTDANENNNTYSKVIGKDKVVFTLINNMGGDVPQLDFITLNIYQTGQKNNEINLLGQIPPDYGGSLKAGQAFYCLLDPGIYDMEIIWDAATQPGYGGGGPFKVYSQYGVNITGNYNWVLNKAVVVLVAPQDYPIWGFFYSPQYSYNWSSDMLSEIIPRWGEGAVYIQPGIWDWYVTTSNNETYYIGHSGRKFYGFTFIRIPEPSERDDPWGRYEP